MEETPLRNLVAGIAQALWQTDEQGAVIEDSKSWRAFTGQSWDDYRGSGWINAVHPDDQTNLMESWTSAAQLKESFEAEFRLRKADGSYQWTSARAVAVEDSLTRRKGWIGINVDISARKKAEDEMKERERTLTSIVMNSPSALSLKNVDGRYVIANPNFDRILGLRSETMIGKTDAELFPAEVASKIRTNDQVVLKSSNRLSVEEEIPRQNGELRIFTAHKFPILDLQGNVAYVCTIALDATESKKSARALLESERRTNQMLTSIPQLIWQCLPNGQCNYLSPQWVEYTGVSLQDQLGLNWLGRVIHPDDQERTLKHWMGAVAGEHPYDIEYRIRRFDGKFQWFKTRGTPIRDQDGQITDWFGTCTNIDEDIRLRDQLERREREYREMADIAAKANLAKTQFLANMSHEIRTPIGAIMGFTDLLRDEGVSPADRARYMNIIGRNSENLLRLIDDVLDLTKVEAGKINLEKSEFSLPDLLAEVASVMSLRAQEKGISFTLKVQELIPDIICTDQLRLKQILSNVVGNAIKFTDQGSVRLTVSFESPVLRFVVTDTGAGIPEESVAQLFKPFGQVDPSMNRKYGGSGLGLILSKRLSQELGGDLGLQHSVPGEGSTFVATIMPELPSREALVRQSNTLVAEPARAMSEYTAGPLHQLKVLVVDDSADNRTLLEIYLGKTGATVAVAKDGIEAVEQALVLQPDVVLMDIQMPGLDGHQATQKLRRSGFTKPIIALTAHAMREERDKCFDSGCNDYLTKPVHRERLIEVLSRCLPS